MKKVLTIALMSLASAGTLSLAAFAQADSANNPKADIQSGNANCGADLTSLPVIGFTNFHRDGNTVSIAYHLKNARPNATYHVQLWGNSCSYFATITVVTTNENGVANGIGSTTVPAASTRFFATAYGPNGYNDTPAVTLAP